MVLATFLAATLAAAPVTALAAFVLSGGRSPWQGGEALATPWLVFLAIIVSDLAFVAAVYLLLVRRRVATWGDLGLRRPRGSPFARGILWGLAFLAVSAAVSVALSALGVEQDQASQFPLDGAGAIEKAAVWIAGVVFVPFAEELFFRGYMLQAMTERKGPFKGLAFSSLIFAAAHMNIAALLPLLAGSLVLGVAYRRSGDLWTTMVAHGFNNAVALTALMVSLSE